ncbi:uncharacterized protein LOC127745559 isoform X3 [Arachis duranensis]|uniref:Uncharacterized protein LOC107475909 isoform X3 n=1 Tax=Arachis duranensis TaxID=130453 RepID=A0A9C6TD18_ARADU|nr:uncharacterized protein LOC107475909 isoform X3 [Arachis duranensis]XP_052114326.1 uncharacterized protein LOC127745559 isoform X3 [Arachis duranensis]
MVGIKRDSVQMRKAAKKIGQGKKGKERFHEIDDEEDRVVPPLKLVRFRCPTLIHSSFVRKLEKLENKNFITYLEQMLNCLKKGLTKEKQLASQALGLMAISVCETENADEVYRYTISQVTKLLRVPDKLLEPCGFIALVECLAIVTSFCASNSVEIQEAMQVIWEYICPKSKVGALKNQVSATTLSTLIYAWMFLLTRVYRLEIISGRWQGVISRFLTLLKEDATCVAAGEALALIFERDKVDRFFVKTEELLSESYDGLRKYIKNMILKQLESTSMEAKTAPPLKQMFNNAARTDWDVLMYFKEDKRPKYCEIFDGQKLILTSWTSITQFNFLKNFVGEEEFSYYLMENEVIQELFAFVPYYEEEETPCLYEPIEEKIEAKVYLPGTRGKDPELLTRSQIKKEREQTKSIIDKSRTKLMNKRRTFAEERKGKGYFEEVESAASLFGLLF